MTLSDTRAVSPLLDLLFEDDLVGRCVVAPDGSVLRANRQWLRSTGFTLDDVLGASIIDLFPDTRDMALALHARARAGHHVEVPRHAQHVRGRDTWWEGTIDPVPMEGGVGLLITRREVGAEPAPRADPSATALADYLFDVGPAGIVLYEPAPPFRVLATNKAYQDLWPEPLRSRGLVGLGLAEYVPRVEESGIADVFRAVARTGVPRYIEEFAYDGFPGGTRWFNWTLSPVVRNGRIVVLAHMAVDVTREVRAREVARQAVAESHHAAELLEFGDPFCELDGDFRIIRVNAAHERINGHRREEILGRTHWQVWPDSALPSSPYWREYHRCMRDRVRVEFDAYYAPLDVWTSVIAYPTAQGGIAIFWRDISERKRAEAALRVSEEKLRVSFAGAAIGFALTTPDGRFLDANPAYCAITGYTLDELRVLTFEDLVEAEDLAENLVHRQRLLAGDVPSFVLEGRYRRKGGSPVWVRKSVSIVRDATGEPQWNIALVEDITDRKRAELIVKESQERLNAHLDNSPLAVIEFDPQLRVTRWSRQAEQMFGWSADELVGRAIHELRWVHEEDVEAVARESAGMLTGERPRSLHVNRNYRKDGSVVFCEWYNSAIYHRDGRLRSVLSQVLDVTERRRAEDALRRANERLREVDQRKDEFLAMLSHELRNPLAPIRNSIYLIDRTAPDSEAARRGRAVIRRQTEHLARLVDDLLDVTRISRGKIELGRERVDLRELVRKITEDLHGTVEQAGIELRVEHLGFTPVWVDVDPTRLSQVIGNLLQNATKFTPAGGSVTVSLAAGAAAELRVRDTGSGIEPADLQRMFEPFAQARQSLARTKGGLGLGLALVKGIVELHGGEVEARSEGLGRGAEFVVRLPLAGPPEPSPDAVAPIPAVVRRIVIIEDNLDAAQSLADVLALAGHEVSTARDAGAGIALVREVRPDVVLCDLGLPGLDGFEVARALRRDPRLRDVRLIALSGYAQAEDRERSRAAGFDEHLAKPADLDQLTRVLAARP